MINKKTGFIITIVLTLVCASLLVANITNAYAKRKYQPLQGITIVLDAGHGGIDGGAQAGSIKEEQINLSIVVFLKEKLEKAGASVVLTRDGDFDLASEDAKNRKRDDMAKRMALINQEDTDLFLSIHLNSYPNTSVKGAQAFYEKNNEVSKVFADIIQKHLKELTDSKMTSKTGDYYILNNANKVGSLVECGFLSNAQDRAKLVKEEYQKKLAQTLFDSIAEYFAMIS